MTDVAPGIITNGLGGSHTNMIVGFFHLGFFEGTVVVPPPKRRGGGGSGIRIPIDLRNEDDYPPDRKIEITVKIRFRDGWRERIFWVIPKQADILVKIFDFINTSSSRVSFAVSGVQRKMSSVIATIANITNRSEKK